MCPPLNNPESRPDHEDAFSLVELLVAVSITTVIIFALYAIFDHTQKAFRGSISQVDVMESGRAAMDLMTRELEQLSASNETNVVNLFAQRSTNTISFQQSLPGNMLRTNRFQDFFFLNRFNNNWSLAGYTVVPSVSGSGVVGTLWRHSTNSINRAVPFNIMSAFINGTSKTVDLQPVIDGVIHLTLLPYDDAGSLMTWTNRVPGFVSDPRTSYHYFFLSNALPRFVELELGILEPQILEQYKSMPSNVASNFLARQAGRVHLFRQRIAIHTASR